MLLQINNIKLTPGQGENDIPSVLFSLYNIRVENFIIIKRSLDARKKQNIHYNYRIITETDPDSASLLLQYDDVEEYHFPEVPETLKSNFCEEVIIVGAGPAGLFAALRLIESGARVIILERGRKVEERMKDIELLEKYGKLDPESNALFGEGGAGTYSDGKLTTRINRPEILWFYKKLIEHGAPASAAYESKPHIGTDQLQKIVTCIREYIISSGSEIRFRERVTDLIISQGKVTGVTTSSGAEYKSSTVILAAGHSARDIYELLHNKKIVLEKKAFAVGTRIEHPAELINSIQYGNSKYQQILPAAEYRLTHNNKASGRGVYSFCMCPGGSVINSSSENSQLCVNGMSMSGRDYKFSNSAIVVTVKPEDTTGTPLGGIEFQREIERKAFSSGGGDFISPAQSVKSFISGKADKQLPPSSYRNGIMPSRLENFLPVWITDEIRSSLHVFNRKMNGFVSDNAILIGAETRTSSPVRITRDSTLQSVSVRGLYPAGEGAGYAGGIVSSAVDGIRCADAIISLYFTDK